MKLIDWHAIARHFHPVPKFEYYLNFFHTIEQISLHCDASKRAQIHLNQAVLVLVGIMFLLYSLYVPTGPESLLLEAMVFDFYSFIGFHKLSRLIFGSVAVGMIYVYKIFYFDFYRNPMRSVLYNALVCRDCCFTLGCSDLHLRLWMMTVLRAFQQGSYATILLFASACYQLTAIVVRAPFIGYNFTTAGVVGVFLVCGFLFASLSFFSISVSCIASCVSLGTSLLFRSRHRAVTRLLAPRRLRERAALLLLRKFMRENVRTLLYMNAQNEFLGLLIMVMIALCGPMSCALLVTAFTSTQIGDFQRTMMLTMAAFAMINLQVSHYLAASFSDHLHCHYPRVIRFALAFDRTSGRRWSLKERIRVAHHIQAFHVEQRYGLTYGPLGLISRMAFVNFMFFYTQMLFLAIKIAGSTK